MGRWFDIAFWCLAAGVAAFMVGTFLKILWDTFRINRDPAGPPRQHTSESSDATYSLGSESDTGGGFDATSSESGGGDSGSDSGGW